MEVKDEGRAYKIAEALGGVLGPGPGGDFQCLCPAHLDTTPSLSIKDDGNGGVLANCFSGCSQSAIFAALFRGLWIPPDTAADPAKPAEKPEAASDSGDDDKGGEDEPAEDPRWLQLERGRKNGRASSSIR
jgi:hypothetical protein